MKAGHKLNKYDQKMTLVQFYIEDKQLERMDTEVKLLDMDRSKFIRMAVRRELSGFTAKEE